MAGLLKTLKLIPRRTIIIHLSWLASLFLFVLAAIVPLQRFVASLDGRIKDIEYQTEEQRNLHPIYEALQKKSEAAAPAALPVPERGKLSRDLIGMVPSTIGRIAKNTAMEVVSVTPDVNSLADQPRFLLLNTTVRGNLMNFRKFLIGVGGLPYLERFGEIEIQQHPLFLEFRLKIRLALI